MKNRLLILTTPYDIPSYAPRLRFLCDYLHSKGWELDVYTEASLIANFQHDYPIHYIEISHGKIDWAIKTFWTLLTDWKSRHFTREVLKQIKGKQYDAVFCTTFSSFPLQSALTIARQLHIPLHADIRDLDEQIDGSQYLAHRAWWTLPFRAWHRQVNINRRNRVLRQANQITTISPWHRDFIRQFNPRVELIYNGFDATQFKWKTITAPTFKITYMGRLYSQSFQNPEPLFRAVQELNLPNIEIQFFGNEEVRKRVGDYAQVMPYVPIDLVPTILQESSILLVLTNVHAHGMMTTKFYEALGVEKPILCIPSDNSCLAEVIHDTNAGIATDDIEEIKQFIRDKYAEWKQKGYTHQLVMGKMPFSRQYQAQQFEQLLSAL